MTTSTSQAPSATAPALDAGAAAAHHTRPLSLLVELANALGRDRESHSTGGFDYRGHRVEISIHFLMEPTTRQWQPGLRFEIDGRIQDATSSLLGLSRIELDVLEDLYRKDLKQGVRWNSKAAKVALAWILDAVISAKELRDSIEPTERDVVHASCIA